MKMKRQISLILALVMILGTFTSVFAADTTDAVTEASEFLKEQGVLIGSGAEGDLMLDKNLLRQEAVVLVSRLMGAEDEAFATEGTPTYQDIDKGAGGAYYLPVLAWAQEEGLFQGHSAVRFGYGENITAQEYAKVLLTALGYEVGPNGDVAWEDALAKALELGILGDLDLDNLEPVLRSEVAVMTFNALGVNMNGENTTLADKLEIEMPVEAELAMTVKAVGAKKLAVEFNKAVEEGTFQVKKGSITVNVKEVIFAEDNKSAVIELATKLTKGDYTVTLGEASGVISVENEKVANIELSDSAVLTANAKVITTTFKIFNQYNEDITKTSSLNFTAGKGIVSPNYTTGVLTLDNTTAAGGTDADFTVEEKVTISALHAGTTTFASSVLTVGPQAQVATIDITSLYHADDKTLDVNSTANISEFKLVIDAKDQYGKAIPHGSVANDVLVTVTNSAEIDVKGGFATPTFESITIDGDATTVLELATPKSSPATLTAGKYTITIISKTTGDLARFDVVVKEGVKVDTLSIAAPELAVAGEEFELPFTAVDQFGNAITKASDLTNGMTSLSISAGSIAFEQDYVKNTAKLVVDATGLTAKQTLIVTGITKTNQVVQLSINLVDPAKPTVIAGLKNATINIAKNGATSLKADNVVVKDQYGRDYKVVTGAVNPSLGTAVADYKIVATTSAATKVSLTGTEITNGTDVIQLNGVDKGSSTITLALTNGDATVDVENSEYTFTAKVVEKADIASYEIADFDKLYHISGATHDVSLEVNGLLANGEKVAIPASYYTPVINDDQVTVSGGDIDSVSGYVWGSSQTEREVAVIVTVHAANGPVVLIKNLTVSNVAPKATTLTLKTNGVATLEDEGVVSVAATSLTNAADVKALIIDAVKVVDQYGVEIDEAAWEVAEAATFYTVIVTDLGTETITGVNGAVATTVGAGDTFNITAVTYNGQVVTFKVILK